MFFLLSLQESFMTESMNIQIAEKVVKALVKQGVRCFCLCPGGRSAPLVEVLSHSKGLEVLSFFEERSACFFALGRVRRDNHPVAVLTTSGTAVAELLPAVIEAHYSALPLVLVTSDRPLEFGKQGSPQTLKSAIQVLETYCHTSKDILNQEDIDLYKWNPCKGSLHLNVCFDEPLLDKKPPSLDFRDDKDSENLKYKASYLEDMDKLREDSSFQKDIQNKLKDFFKQSQKPLILIGSLEKEEIPEVKKLLKNYKGLLYIEPLSNLQDGFQRLLSGDQILPFALKKGYIDGVIRLGGIPRVRFWRDLEKSKIPVVHFSSPPFYNGLTRFLWNYPLLPSLNVLGGFLSSLKDFGEALKDFDQKQTEKMKSLIKDHPLSEENWFLTLKESLSKNTKVFLGNSSPIRLWDTVSFCEKKDLYVSGQSGVNGIEGLLSRFLGECEEGKSNIGVLGDLSLLYDMSGFWRAQNQPPWTLVVINNFGGQIFSRLFKNPAFLNRHQISFSSLAQMWGLNYVSYKDVKKFQWPKQAYNLVEIQPSEEETQSFLKKYLSFWET